MPAATFILGLPGEKEEDVIATIELIERLKNYRSLIVPMFFVPLGALKDRGWFRREMITDVHIEALRKAMWHTAKWAEDIVSRIYFRGLKQAPLKLLIQGVIAYIKWRVRRVERRLGLS